MCINILFSWLVEFPCDSYEIYSRTCFKEIRDLNFRFWVSVGWFPHLPNECLNIRLLNFALTNEIWNILHLSNEILYILHLSNENLNILHLPNEILDMSWVNVLQFRFTNKLYESLFFNVLSISFITMHIVNLDVNVNNWWLVCI